jgi:hypothetical protein
MLSSWLGPSLRLEPLLVVWYVSKYVDFHVPAVSGFRTTARDQSRGGPFGVPQMEEILFCSSDFRGYHT